MVTYFVDDAKALDGQETDPELADTHHVSILEDAVMEHRKDVFRSYFTSVLSQVQCQD